MVVGLPPEGLSAAWERDFSAYPPAGVILFGRDFRDLEGLRALTSRLRELARPRRLFLAADEEGGWVSQLAGHLVVPPNAALLARGAAPGDVAWASRVTGERLRALGLDWVFAPVADVHSEPRNPVIGSRAFGADAADVSEHVGQALAGFRQAGIASCLKHFPGHGDTRVDSHLARPVSEATREVLEARELVPFRAHLDADAVMVSHVVYRALDPERPATFSRAVAHGLLRDELGFSGLAITDALEMKGALESGGPFQSARLALEAGADLLLFAFHDEAVRRARLELARALVDGGIDRAAFDAARPRLAAFDRAHPEPGPAEIARPLESLTPPDWEPRLERLVERGLVVEGGIEARHAALPWRVIEPDDLRGPALRDELAALSVPLAEADEPAFEVHVVASRRPLEPDRLEALRAACARGPAALVGLQNDAFLVDVPEAALRLSALDATPLTRRVVARRLAGELRRAMEHRV